MDRTTARSSVEPGIDVSDLGREDAIAVLFETHHLPLVRLATLLGADDAENVVAEAFYQLYRRWNRLRSQDAAVAYLRSTVCNLTRMRLRHLQVVRRHLEEAGPGLDAASVQADTAALDNQRALVDAVKQLPTRQREALVLRYWLDLREVDIAAAMGISAGAVKAHISRGMSALTGKLEELT